MVNITERESRPLPDGRELYADRKPSIAFALVVVGHLMKSLFLSNAIIVIVMWRHSRSTPSGHVVVVHAPRTARAKPRRRTVDRQRKWICRRACSILKTAYSRSTTHGVTCERDRIDSAASKNHGYAEWSNWEPHGLRRLITNYTDRVSSGCSHSLILYRTSQPLQPSCSRS